jgi:hypothetical protein
MPSRDDVRVKIGADDKRLADALRGSDAKLRQFASSGTAALGSVNTSLRATVARAAAASVALAAVYGTAAAARAIVRTSSDFEQLNLQLETVTGSAAGAKRAFDLIRDFAVRTPFQIQGITRAFIDLQGVGVRPTAELLTAFGDIAAARGRDIEDFARAATRAAFGETESLKAFGIAAKVEGDKITLIFGNTIKTVRRDANEVAEALAEIGRQGFGGGAQRQVESYAGAVSNLEDNWANLLDTLGRETGLLKLLAAGMDTLSVAVKRADDFVKEFILRWKLAFDIRDPTLAEGAGGGGASGPGAAELQRLAAVEKVTKALRDQVRQQQELVAAQMRGEAAVETVQDAIAAYKELKGVTVDLTQVEKDRIVALVVQREEAERSFKAQKKAADDLKASYKDLSSAGRAVIDETRTATENYNIRHAELLGLLSQGAISWETYERGVKKAKDEMESAGNKADGLKGVFDNVSVSLSSGFSDAIVEGKKLGDVFQALATDVAKLIIQTQLLKAVQAGVQGLGGLFGSAGTGAALTPAFGLPAAGSSSLTGVAKGAAWHRAGIRFLAKGGVMNSPTAFLERGGLNVAGEAGPEAAVPLKRDRQGVLGIRQAAANVTVNIMTPPNTETSTRERSGPQGKTIDVFVRELVAAGIATPGDPINRALRTNFGLNTRNATR